jgi:hypothetical protein
LNEPINLKFDGYNLFKTTKLTLNLLLINAEFGNAVLWTHQYILHLQLVMLLKASGKSHTTTMAFASIKNMKENMKKFPLVYLSTIDAAKDQHNITMRLAK